MSSADERKTRYIVEYYRRGASVVGVTGAFQIESKEALHYLATSGELDSYESNNKSI